VWDECQGCYATGEVGSETCVECSGWGWRLVGWGGDGQRLSHGWRASARNRASASAPIPLRFRKEMLPSASVYKWHWHRFSRQWRCHRICTAGDFL